MNTAMLILFYIAGLVTGFIIGAIACAYQVAKQIEKNFREDLQHLGQMAEELNKPDPSEDWKSGNGKISSTDEDWLREQLGE